MHADAQVSAIGYSYGTRVICGGLHLAGGGELAGLQLAGPVVAASMRAASVAGEQARPARSRRAVLLAAAIGDDWLVEGGLTDRALGQSSATLSIYSSYDRVLRWYAVAARGNGEALGYRGLAHRPPREDGNGKYAQFDVACLIGTNHDLETYLSRSEITAAAREALSPQPAAAK
jgi:hypothetical protein